MTLIESKVVCILPWLYKQVLESSFFFFLLDLSLHTLTSPSYGCHGEVKLCEKMAQFDTKKSAVASLKRIPQGKKRVHGKRKRKPWLSGKMKKKVTATAPEGELDRCEQELAAEPKAKGLKSPAQEYLFVG